MHLFSVALFWLAVVAQVHGQNYSIRTFAGGGLPDNLAGTSAQLGSVSGVALDKAGDVYMSISDPYNMVLRLDSSGNLTRVAGNGTQGYGGDGGLATSAQLFNPAGLAFDSSGSLYIADGGNNEIRKVTGGVITTFAGGGAGRYSGSEASPVVTGAASGAIMIYPTCIAFDARGTLYIAERSENRIDAVQNGVIRTVAGNGSEGFSGDDGPATDAQLDTPFGIAVDAAGDLYIADSGNQRIRKVSQGIITTVAGTGTAGYSGDNGLAIDAELSSPVSVAVDSSGNLYIADNSNKAVRLVSTGIITTIAGNGVGGQLNYPNDVAVDASGNVYIAESGGWRDLIDYVYYAGDLRRLSGGAVATLAGGGNAPGGNGPATDIHLSNPVGLAMDSNGNMFIADSGNNLVVEVSNGVAKVVAGTGAAGYAGDNGPATSALLNVPRGVAIDRSGNLYIADHSNHCIRMVSSQGIITTVAGNGFPGFSGDNGPATSASLYGPDAVVGDPDGNLYIADTYNNRVRKVSGGIITTIAGTGVEDYNGDAIPAVNANLGYPTGLAIDQDRNLYVTEYDNDRIRKISNGIITTVAGASHSGHFQFAGDGGPATQALLCEPWGLSLDSAGNLYFADECSSRVRKISNGIITSIAGDGSMGFNGDGGHPATNVELNSPTGIATDSAGNIYVAEAWNNRVRVLTPTTQACTYSVTPTAIQINYAGGSFVISVQTDPLCAWDSLGLPPSSQIALMGIRSYYTDFYMPLSFGGGVGPGSIAIVIPPGGGELSDLGVIPWPSQILVGGIPVTFSGKTGPSGAILSAQKTHQGGFTQGQIGASYSVVVSNAAGSAPTVGAVSVTEAIPTGLALESMSGTGWACWANTCMRVDNLKPGASYPPITVIVDVAMDAPAQVKNQVTVSEGGISAATAADQTTLQVFSKPTISANGLKNAASYGTAVAPGSIAAAFGNFLLNSAASGSGLPLPVNLSGLSVQFGNGTAAPLFYVSGTQVNAQVPWELAGQTQSTMTVTVNGQTSPILAVNMASFAPGIFSVNGQGTGQGAVQDASFHLVDSSNPATAGSTVIVIYCTGLGPVTNQPASGSPSPASPLAQTTTTPVVSIGGAPAQVLWSGLTPGAVGLYQVDALVPAGSSSGSAVPVSILMNGVISNTVTIAVKAH
jgi:uncharacterized protein (TIGR03437 family)